ncbi:MAG: cell wall hydrolase [Oscillospiraceae bacterium]|mgnify:CR=1 FL=1|nr:cell wall hydrolase [Oscillospiraceae bacterium]MDD3832867.1 cell wall hydrolase [Oscillospiraceae bacterium]MDD4546855.1 cell wall hydrolase [Oscillospiraceae bacterium]
MDDRELFARLIKCEAEGEGEHGMKAVATVVMNRVRVPYGEYFSVNRGNIRNVIYQPRQFTCLATEIAGVANIQNIWSMTPDPIHYEIADWALSGNIFSGVGAESLWYMNPYVAECPDPFPYNGTGYWYTRVNQHCFFNPTNLYAQT